ncbi:hypothetical protein Glove_590g13 [Diversispora epigaea]|uniref:Uncharacterized protein n=1 Tax=Diversispora epigaea TaxID=1348612 RepID=A0A397G992_9GLOM|nr:hypothetical protein Glove_590g13 [Diversispora epigaea]
MTNIARNLLIRDKIPTIVSAKKPKQLFEILNVYPDYGVGLKVAPNHWIDKGITECYYEVTNVKLKMKDITHGKAFGIKVWKGKILNEGKPERIRGTYKWSWKLWPIKKREERIISWA